MSSNFINRMLGTADGSAGITPVGSDGQPVRNASDRFGRLWVRLFQGSAPVDASNPVPVSVQSSALPVGAATEATLAAVEADTTALVAGQANLATEVTLTAVSTWTQAAQQVLGTTVDAADRTGIASTINAKLRGMAQSQTGGLGSINGVISRGNNLRGTALTQDYPVRVGGQAVDPTALPPAEAIGSAMTASYSQQGEACVVLSTPIAGEDRTNNVLNVWPLAKSISTGWTNTHSNSATTQQHNFIAAAGNIKNIRGLNLSNQPLYLFLCSKGSSLVNGDAPFFAPFPVPPGGYVSEDFGDMGLRSGVGWRAGWSTTPTTLTLADGGPISGQVI